MAATAFLGPRPIPLIGQKVGHRGQQERAEPAQAFIEEMGWTYPSLFDPSPNGDVERELGFFAQPVTVFYDRTGKQVDQVSGPVSTTDLAAGIAKASG